MIVIASMFFGCETTFEPLQPNDQYVFSMYGAVDLQGDYTKIRVMPIGETLIPRDPEPNGTEVTLIRNSTGDLYTLNDSLFRFGGDAYVWNYFADETLQPNEEYTLFAESPDGGQSHAVISIPSVLPIPEVEYSTATESGTISGSSVDPVVTIETRYIVQVITDFGCEPEREISISHTEDAFIYRDGRYLVDVNNRPAIGRRLGPSVTDYVVNSREVVVISASEDWPDTDNLTDEEMVLPDVVTNVENGTGFVAGISSQTVQVTPRREPC